MICKKCKNNFVGDNMDELCMYCKEEEEMKRNGARYAGALDRAVTGESQLPDPNASFLASGKYYLKDLKWGEDEYGAYWNAKLFNKATRRCEGMVGSLYDLDDIPSKGLIRVSREEQEIELKKYDLR